MPLLILKSKNKKVGNIAATYASIKGTCPDSCKLKNNGCYAQMGPTGIHVARLDRKWKHNKQDAYAMARAEARLIDGALSNSVIRGRPLRLHVSGDVRTRKAARVLASAAKRWHNAGGGQVYSYTHSWENIPREHFGNISILASVEKVSDANKATKLGYASSIIVEKFPNGPKAFHLPKSKLKFIPCPQQTMSKTCEQCKLCMRDDLLKKNNLAIAFEVHGVRKNKVLTVLK